jgi:predicted MPP superfamily phosphohydrolase
VKAPTRRQMLKLGLAAGSAGAIGVPAYTYFVEPRWLRSSQWRMEMPGAPTMRVLHLSDMHLSRHISLDFIGKAIDRGLAQKPDLICLTGDFVTRDMHDAGAYSKLLSRLSDTAPTFAVTGNHDGGSWMAARGGPDSPAAVLDVLANAKVRTLSNENAEFALHGKSVDIIGVSDLWSRDLDPDAAFAEATSDIPRIVLSHNPDSKEQLANFSWNLLLSGHTHGGQLRIPITGGTPFAPVRDRRYVHGLYPWEGRHLHITAGIGNLHGLRFNCRPEVSVLDINS